MHIFKVNYEINITIPAASRETPPILPAVSPEQLMEQISIKSIKRRIFGDIRYHLVS